MTVRKKFELGADVAEALKNIVNINNGLPEEHSAVPVRKTETDIRNARTAEKTPAPVQNEAGKISAWYSAMKPRAMGSFLWIVLLADYAERHGGALVFDELSEQLGIARERVVRAVNDLKRSGYITVIHSELGPGGTVVSREVRFNVPASVQKPAQKKKSPAMKKGRSAAKSRVSGKGLPSENKTGKNAGKDTKKPCRQNKTLKLPQRTTEGAVSE